MNKCPTNKEEWWKLVDDNWEDLQSLIVIFHPSNKSVPKLKITANRAEKVRQSIVKKITTIPDYKELKKNRDPKLAGVLDDTYWGIPESVDCWNYKGFGLLCDLCSESYVLYDNSYSD